MGTRPRLKIPTGAYRIPSGAQSASSLRPQSSPSLAGQPAARRTLSLRARLIAVVVSVALLPLLAATVGGIYLARTSLKRQGEQVLLHRANASATTIDSYLAGIRGSLMSSGQEVGRLVASDPQLRPETIAAIETVMRTNSVANSFSATESSEFLTNDGKVLASDQLGEEGEDLSKSPTVQAALNGTYTLSGLAFDPIGSSDLRETMEAAAPVYAPGSGSGARPIGVVRVRFSAGRFVRLVKLDQSSQGGAILVERDTGLVLAESLLSSDLTFNTIVPLSDTVRSQLVSDRRYSTATAKGAVPVRAISGLGLSQLQQGPTFFTAGTFDGAGGATMLYARVPIANAPASTPWVYLLATREDTLTALADQWLSFDNFPQLSLAQIAIGLLLLALILSLGTGLYMAGWIGQWLASTVRELGATAHAFFVLSDEQRQTAEEQRHRLGAARTALHDLHRTAGELFESVERGMSYAEDGYRERPPALPAPLEGAASFAMAQPSQGAARWSQWAVGVRERLNRQYDICSRLAQEARITADMAGRMRERSSSIATQASELEAALWPGGVVVAVGDATANRAAPARSARWEIARGFSPGTLRLALVGVLLVFGLLPSLALGATTNTLLRGNLSTQSDQALDTQAQSHASTIDAVLGQQQQEVAGLSTVYQQLYQYQRDQTSAITPTLVSEWLAAAVAAATSDLGTQSLQLASASTGTVLAASSSSAVGSTLTALPAFQQAKAGRTSVSGVYYDPAKQQGWYYVAAPMRTLDQTQLIGVAVGQFGLTPIARLVDQTTAQSTTEGGNFALLVERNDLLVLADSRSAANVFTTAKSLDSATLSSLWSTGRYPQGHVPHSGDLPEVASQVLASASPQPRSASFTGTSGTNAPDSNYWLIPLANAPWDLVEALPAPAANAVADQLTRYDLILSLAIAVLTTALALVLGQSIVVPVRRLRSRFRQAAHRLVAATRKQDEAARRQEAVLPPIESTAQLLALETEEVGDLLFRPRSASSVGQRAMGQTGPGVPTQWDTPVGPASFGNQPAYDAWGAGNPWAAQSVAPGYGASSEPTVEGLRRARVLANDWGLRQQRILADLASALNATDQLSRASGEGHREATELTTMAAELLTSAR